MNSRVPGYRLEWPKARLPRSPIPVSPEAFLLALGFLCLVSLVLSTTTWAAPKQSSKRALSFSEVDLGLPGVESGSVAWADYDDDGDLDLLLTGWNGTEALSRIYRNDAGDLTDISASLPGVYESSADWWDYDGDGDLDLFLTGYSPLAAAIFRLYRNDGGIFTRYNILVAPAIRNGDVVYADADNDGDQDLLVTASRNARVFKNNGGTSFTVPYLALPGLVESAAGWVDYDNDGDMDFLLAGYAYDHNIARLYRNDGRWNFTEVDAGLPAVQRCSVAWGDYDGDGDQDLLLTGWTGVEAISRVYRNDGGALVDLAAGLPGVSDGSAAWGDFDNDGDLDILLTGDTGSGFITRVYRNDVGIFTELGLGLPGVAHSAVAWADYDGDGDLDLLLTGSNGSEPLTRMYRNDGVAPNTPPSSPGNPREELDGISATLRWESASDAETPTAGISYNLRIGTTPGGNEISPAMANPETGFRRVLKPGNVQQGDSRRIFLTPGTYYWSVQALDGALDSSAFTAERSFTIRGFVSSPNAPPGSDTHFAAWGDYDNDGDLDVLLGGLSPYNDGYQIYDRESLRIYRNDGGNFTDIRAGLPYDEATAWDWVDYDGDGDLDVFLSVAEVLHVYRNNDGSFEEIDLGLGRMSADSSSWGDYDNDGDLDLVVTGSGNHYYNPGRRTVLYRNDIFQFQEISTGLPDVAGGEVAWGDYDNDGDLDLLLTGWVAYNIFSTGIYRNDHGSFVESGVGLPEEIWSHGAWGDFDDDGDLDLVLSADSSGGASANALTRIYRNDGGNFGTILAEIPGVAGALNLADFDNDGDLDILFDGNFRLFRNDGGSFHDFVPWGSEISGDSASWGDYDNDGDLDVLLASPNGALLYGSQAFPSNHPPSAPTNLSVRRDGPQVILKWDPASDAETPAEALSYNLRFGLTPGGEEIISSQADPISGYRRVVRIGNAQEGSSWKVKIPYGTYYWSVQAIDGAYAGSVFSPEFQLSGIGFNDAEAGLVGVDSGSLAWGDYDNDGALDILLTGSSVSGPASIVYHNDRGAFSAIAAGLTGVEESAVAWGDYDNDGDLDILLCGMAQSGAVTRVYRNDEGAFVDIAAGLPGVFQGSAEWGDDDNDGDLDILLTGTVASGCVTRIYRNEAGVFVDADAGLPGISTGFGAWGDYDHDGDLDLLLAGYTGYMTMARVYRNDGGIYAAIGAGLPGVTSASGGWGDFDGDGSLDILLAGTTGHELISRVYRNDNGSFHDIGAGLPGVVLGSAIWGDRDDDGDLDILLSGYTNSGLMTRVYRNEAGSFIESDATLPGLMRSAAAWGDYDEDGDLDLLLAGSGSSSDVVSRVYRNEGAPANHLPSTPTNLVSIQESSSSVAFKWDAASDPETSQAGLSYNLRIGTTPGDDDVLGAMAEAGTGKRLVARSGNANQNASWTLHSNLQPGSYYWSVQAIDATLGASPFADGKTFNIVRFSDAGIALPGANFSTASWCDYDNDDDLDLLLTGRSTAGAITRLYRNDDENFTQTSTPFPGVEHGALAWGDYDGDGDLDLLLTGASDAGPIARIYAREGSGYRDLGAGLEGVSSSACAWGDYDNDGDLDILLAGDTGSGLATLLYRNDNGTFNDIEAGLPGVASCALEWNDYDGDGDLDILLSGNSEAGSITRIYRNEQGNFTDAAVGLPGVYDACTSSGDFDNDGDLDIALAGWTQDGRITRIYRNDEGSFHDIEADLPGVDLGSLAWGDYDNDGALDLLLTGGSSGEGILTRLYRNEGGVFRESSSDFPGVYNGFARWGDYDNDGDLDILLGGFSTIGPIARIYRSEGAPTNTRPFSPTNLRVIASGTSATFAWNAAYDRETPTDGLSYCLRVGITPEGGEISPGFADPGNGYRRIVWPGSLGANTEWTVHDLPLPGVIYWSVQTVDAAMAGSELAIGDDFDGSRFVEVETDLIPGDESYTCWGDYDNDGDLDLLSQCYNRTIGRNDDGLFTATNVGLPFFYYGSGDWGDYDSDGDLDLLILGEVHDPTRHVVSRIYRNDNGVFNEIGVGFAGIARGSAAWVDFDNDGDLDAFLCGSSDTENLTKMYRNDSGVFHPTSTGLPAMYPLISSWADYDNDGDLDLFVAGYANFDGSAARLYRNDYGTFIDSGVTFDYRLILRAAWGDYDSDGDLDLLLTGTAENGGSFVALYQNVAGTLTPVDKGLPNLWTASGAWGDYDSDGDMDLVLLGADAQEGLVGRIYRNDDGEFHDCHVQLSGLLHAKAAWADYDGDGDLDLVTIGGREDYREVIHLYRNEGFRTNVQPSAPTNLVVEQSGRGATLLWDPASDEQTPQAGLSYNLRIGTTPGGGEIFSGMADYLTGYRRLARFGPINGDVRSDGKVMWRLRELPRPATIYWSVQAIDGGFAGSEFSSQDSIRTVVTAVSDPLPSFSNALEQNYPNPFNPSTEIQFSLAARGKASLVIYNTAGRRVATLADEVLDAGVYRRRWTGCSDSGAPVASGVYYYRLRTPGFTEVKRMLLLK